MIDDYVSDLCDKYSHFGEFLSQEFADQGVSKRSVARNGCSTAMASRVLSGKASIGPVASAAFGKALNAPPDHYEKLFRLFQAEKARRNKV